uniref:IgLON family member 5 n=1 Tax=Erpetoichthys calabaricus TaxID=27687 RepID=A0A8C4SWY2_ERPCA
MVILAPQNRPSGTDTWLSNTCRLLRSPCVTLCCFLFLLFRCFIDSEVVHKAWLNRSNILFTGNDKWSLDPRVTVISNNKSEFSIKINNVSVIDEGTYTCSYQSRNEPRTAHVYLIVQVPAKIVNISADISVNEGSNVNLFCLAIGRPEPTIKWKHKNMKIDSYVAKEEMLWKSGTSREREGQRRGCVFNGPIISHSAHQHSSATPSAPSCRLLLRLTAIHQSDSVERGD